MLRIKTTLRNSTQILIKNFCVGIYEKKWEKISLALYTSRRYVLSVYLVACLNYHSLTWRSLSIFKICRVNCLMCSLLSWISWMTTVKSIRYWFETFAYVCILYWRTLGEEANIMIPYVSVCISISIKQKQGLCGIVVEVCFFVDFPLNN